MEISALLKDQDLTRITLLLYNGVLHQLWNGAMEVADDLVKHGAWLALLSDLESARHSLV